MEEPRDAREISRSLQDFENEPQHHEENGKAKKPQIVSDIAQLIRLCIFSFAPPDFLDAMSWIAPNQKSLITIKAIIRPGTSKEPFDLQSKPAWVHVAETRALEAFIHGEWFFHVTPHGIQLERFLETYGLKSLARRDLQGELPRLDLSISNRPVYIACKKS
jgi:hypothetical protein